VDILSTDAEESNL